MKNHFNGAFLIFLTLASVAFASPTSAEEATPTAFAQILESYETVRLALTLDSMDGISEQARHIESILASLSADLSSTSAGVPAGKVEEVQGLLPALEKAAADLSASSSLSAARDAFYALSMPLVRWRKAASVSTEASSTAAASTWADGIPTVAYCPMAKRSWLQPEGEIGNPYHGQAMLTCGEVVDG